MRTISHPVDHYEKYLGVPEGLFKSKVAIVDNEIANDISDGWEYDKGIPVVTGILFENTLTIYMAETKDDKDFEKTLCKKLYELSRITKLCAFNKFMEMGNFKGAFGQLVPMEEIKPFNAKGWNKDRFFSYLQEKQVIPDNFKIKDPFLGDARKCVFSWEEYIKTGDSHYLLDIAKHNINCLLKESVIFKYRQWFRKKFPVDKKGWLK